MFYFLCSRDFKVDNMLEKIQSDNNRLDSTDPLLVNSFILQ